MSTGKRDRVVISCVTFDTVRVTDPLSKYNPDRIHLIHYCRGGSGDNVYQEFYETVCDQIHELPNGKGISIVEHNENVTDYNSMFRTVHGIIEYENGLGPTDIYVNISAGSTDYIAAASMASMMYDNTIPFTVRSKEYTVRGDMIRKCYYSSDGKPLGMTASVEEPRAVSKIRVQRPEKNNVLALRDVKELIEKDADTRASLMIYTLKTKGRWKRKYSEEELSEKRCSRYDLTYFHRDFMDGWISDGWIEKDEYQNKYRVTDKGLQVLSVFYTEMY